MANWTVASGTASWNANVSVAGYLTPDRKVRIWARAEDAANQYSSTSVTVTYIGGQPPADNPRINITHPKEGKAVWDANSSEICLRVRNPDLEKPVARMNSPDTGPRTKLWKIKIRGNASDNVGIAWMDLYVDHKHAATRPRGSNLPHDWSHPVELTHGKNIVNATATDASMNVGEGDGIIICKEGDVKPFLPGFEPPALVFALPGAIAIALGKRR